MGSSEEGEPSGSAAGVGEVVEGSPGSDAAGLSLALVLLLALLLHEDLCFGQACSWQALLQYHTRLQREQRCSCAGSAGSLWQWLHSLG